jgi:hypothetical protein
MGGFIMTNRAAVFFLIAVALVALARFATAENQPVQLPYIFHDDRGSNWDVLYDGSIGDGGNDLYDGGGRLFINNSAQYQSQTQQVMLDTARNELTFPPQSLGGVSVSRRVAVLPSLATVRFTEVLENPTAAAIKVQLRCYFNMGGSVQVALPLIDERRPRQQPMGYAIGDQNNAVAMIAAGRGCKLQPRFNYRQNDDNVDIFYDVEVPPHQTVAIVHCQLRRQNAAEAADAWANLKEKQLLADIPRDLRKRIVNFPTGDAFIGDLEILRGDTLDIVELRGGDTYRGSLKIDRFNLQTLYGPLTLSPDRVVAMLNVGLFRPSQLLVTSEGEVLGGRLDVDSIKLQLTSGQVTSIPISQITRLGFRKRAGEGEEWNFENKAMAYLSGGERLRVKAPATSFNLATPSGPISLSPAVVASIVFQGDENNVPEVHLIDGSRLSALLGTSSFEMTLVGLGAGEQRARLPAAALLRFSFAPEQETNPLTPTLTLSNHDQLIGTIGGTLSLETPFDTLHVEGNQVKALTHTRAGEHDVQITLWDDSTLSGRLVESHLTCQLKCGVAVRVPIALLENYDQPLPLPSPLMVERIKQVARDLDSDDWRVRDRAQSQILAVGPPAMSVLKQIQPTAPAETSQRIDLIISRLSSELEKRSGPTPASGDGGDVGEIDRQGQPVLRW